MEHAENCQEQRIDWLDKRKIQNLRVTKKNYFEKTKERKRLLKASTQESIRYMNLIIIESERKKIVPKLNLSKSSIHVRRQLKAKVDLISNFQIIPQENFDEQEQANPQRKSKYVLEINKENLQPKYLPQIEIQQEKAKNAFKNYNKYKVVTSEYFIWIIFIIVFSMCKLASIILKI